jgi:L-fuconolactonase
MRVDAHQHFWRYTNEEFGWINDAMATIRRDFLPGDLLPMLEQSSVDATVAVQARQSIEETRWLLELADEHEWIAGVVGWVPLIDPRVDLILEELSENAKLKGVRHVLQAEPGEYMARADFNSGVALLRRFSLAYDVLVAEYQLPAAIQFVDRHPRQPFVLDHVAKPKIAAREFEPWAKNIREMARRPHVVCKLSGMATEADFIQWSVEDLKPYVETVLEAFGPERLLFGSDWPVCTVASSYARWVSIVEEFLSKLSVSEQKLIFGRNAVSTYRLSKI